MAKKNKQKLAQPSKEHAEELKVGLALVKQAICDCSGS